MPINEPKRKCLGKDKQGNPCPNAPRKGGEYCRHHTAQADGETDAELRNFALRLSVTAPADSPFEPAALERAESPEPAPDTLELTWEGFHASVSLLSDPSIGGEGSANLSRCGRTLFHAFPGGRIGCYLGAERVPLSFRLQPDDPAEWEKLLAKIKRRNTLLGIETPARGSEAADGNNGRKTKEGDFSEAKQPTFLEVRALGAAMCDGPTLRNWLPVVSPGETALIHQEGRDAAHQIKFASRREGGDLFGVEPSLENMETVLRQGGFFAFKVALVALAEIIGTRQAEVTLPLDTIIQRIGGNPRSVGEREDLRRRVWHSLLLSECLIVVGARPGSYKDHLRKKTVDLQSYDALFRIMGARAPLQLSIGNIDLPVEVTLKAGPWLGPNLGNRAVLSDFGRLQRLMQIPSGRPGGEWAQSIGLALSQYWREQAKKAKVRHVGGNNLLTVEYPPVARETLLSRYRCDPDYEALLGSSDPKRAVKYWNDAITHLKEVGHLGYYQEIDRQPLPRQGWDRPWRITLIEARPGSEVREDAAELVRAHETARRRGKKPKGPDSAPALPLQPESLPR